MRIVTYNIHGWRSADGRPNLDAIASVLRARDADIIGLDEVFYPRVVQGSAEPALAALAAQLGMHFVFGPCLRWPAENNIPADAYGNAILSRWPIIASSAHHLTSKEEDPHNLLAAKEQRGLLEGRIRFADGRTFTVYQIHLDHTDEVARAIQLRIARTWLIRDRNRPHIVMGDFNAVSVWDFADRAAAWAEIVAHPLGQNLAGGAAGPQVIAQMEKAGYVDIYQRFGPPGERSYLTSQIPIRIDYIFSSHSLVDGFQDCKISPDAGSASDHLPVVANLTLPPVAESITTP